MEQEKENSSGVSELGTDRILIREITREERDRIFFQEGTGKWDQVHLVLPDPVWEKVYDEDVILVYEGYTLDHKAFGAGRAYFPDGSLRQEGIFGLKGLLSGKAFYPNGVIRFEGLFRLNQGYGPNFPDYGIWYDRDGRMLYRGKFGVARSSLGFPRVEKPEGFGSVPDNKQLKGAIFMWEDAKRLMRKEAGQDEKD